ncbi:MAG TPA: undecaprenyldiphospho-muramoylpentapeptide beta-N-acetylglucosaminyltransferase [Polyangiaceae bacterium]
MRALRVVLAGGGTGGHVFPMIAVADALRSLDPSLELSFVGTARGLESRLVPERGYPLRLVEILPLRGGGALGAWRGATQAVRATLAERRALAELRPDVVFSVGGYAAGPVAAAARSRGIPVALMEPNSVIGLANRLIAPFVQRAYTAFAASERHFPAGSVLRTGVPIRSGFERRPYRRGEVPTVLVLGGSQGAKSLNEALPEAFSQLKQPLCVVHQCGAAHIASVEALYAAVAPALGARVIPFIEDMPAQIAAADLVVSRSGAGAVSEICAIGRASLLVPYPYAAGDHQTQNAVALEVAGAARRVDAAAATPERLRELLSELLGDPTRLDAMAAAAGNLGRPDAAREVASDLLRLAGLSLAHARSGRGSARSGAISSGPLGLSQLDPMEVR